MEQEGIEVTACSVARRAPSVGEIARRRLTESGRRAIGGIAVPLVAGSRSHPLSLDRRQPSSAWGIVELSDSNVAAVLRTVRRPLSSMGSRRVLGIFGSLAGFGCDDPSPVPP